MIDKMVSLTSIIGKNENLLPHVMNVYAKDGFAIADVTYGNGNFWKKIDLDKYKFYPSDIKTNGYDFRDLPYADEFFDMVALDPPYMHGSRGKPIHARLDAAYRNNHRDGYGTSYVHNLYLDGIKESWRVLKFDGVLLLKCQDQIEGGKNHFEHITFYNMALDLGFFAEDLFVLTMIVKPLMRHTYQLHARKNHSYLWVFRKPKKGK